MRLCCQQGLCRPARCPSMLSREHPGIAALMAQQGRQAACTSGLAHTHTLAAQLLAGPTRARSAVSHWLLQAHMQLIAQLLACSARARFALRKRLRCCLILWLRLLHALQSSKTLSGDTCRPPVQPSCMSALGTSMSAEHQPSVAHTVTRMLLCLTVLCKVEGLRAAGSEQQAALSQYIC